MGGLGGALDGASRWVDEHKRAIAYGKKGFYVKENSIVLCF